MRLSVGLTSAWCWSVKTLRLRFSPVFVIIDELWSDVVVCMLNSSSSRTECKSGTRIPRLVVVTTGSLLVVLVETVLPLFTTNEPFLESPDGILTLSLFVKSIVTSGTTALSSTGEVELSEASVFWSLLCDVSSATMSAMLSFVIPEVKTSPPDDVIDDVRLFVSIKFIMSVSISK